jgi:hypothetical protein
VGGNFAHSLKLPSAEALRRAIEIFLDRAYGPSVPPRAARFLPPDDFDPARWLMSDVTERDPPDAPPANVRSFALRIGNARYPHMKLRLSRPPNDDTFVFSVDSHDAFLCAPAGSPDRQELEELKRHNAAVASAVLSAWDAEGLLTERNYLRQQIRQTRAENVRRRRRDPPADRPPEAAGRDR